jgi:tRNA(fMet)-specific endonuclease VapC
MTLWVLDTDSLSLLERGNSKIQERLRQVNADSVAISIVTAEEKMKGRLAAINSLSGIERVDRLAIAYRDLQSSIEDLQTLPILPFSELATDRYRELLQQKIRIGSHDLRIAAIVLSVEGILVTRNRRDFERVPGLQTEFSNLLRIPAYRISGKALTPGLLKHIFLKYIFEKQSHLLIESKLNLQMSCPAKPPDSYDTWRRSREEIETWINIAKRIAQDSIRYTKS